MREIKVIAVVGSNKEINLYSDGEVLTKLNLPPVEEVYEVVVEGKSYLVTLAKEKLVMYDAALKELWAVGNVRAQHLTSSANVIAYCDKGVLTLVDFETKTTTVFSEKLDEETLKIFVSKQKEWFAKKGANESLHLNESRYLLYTCTKSTFHIYVICL